MCKCKTNIVIFCTFSLIYFIYFLTPGLEEGDPWTTLKSIFITYKLFRHQKTLHQWNHFLAQNCYKLMEVGDLAGAASEVWPFSPFQGVAQPLCRSYSDKKIAGTFRPFLQLSKYRNILLFKVTLTLQPVKLYGIFRSVKGIDGRSANGEQFVLTGATYLQFYPCDPTAYGPFWILSVSPWME